ncbi:cytochrome c oxidase assembly protein [Nesterenkonia lutea]|uniref:Copper resistance protein D n=1 Tax=Nesterenkonia lutea TaxID=272919 RepID=A0ABR9JC11_9MICC|nr:cytochrome c oxidase assembly protein [Nesterenkonia lutea]MBE1523458.1 putative copper resistance protein D [Nesterenkonia lutea]
MSVNARKASETSPEKLASSRPRPWARSLTGSRGGSRGGLSAPTLLGAASLVALLVTLAGAVLNGAAVPQALVDPGAFVRWGLPVTTLIVRLSGMVALGGLTLCGAVLAPNTQAWHRAAAISAAAALCWALAQTLYLLLAHASMMGTPIAGPGYLELLVGFVVGIELGSLLAWAVMLATLTAVLAVLSSTPAGARWAAAAAILALIPIAGLGHSGSAGNHDLAVSAMWLHLVGLGWWAGGLIVLFVSTSRTGENLVSAAGRFSTIAGWAVAMVVLSGACSLLIRVTDPVELVSTLWGQLILVKLGAFLLLGIAGWWHRRVTLPALAHADGGHSGPFRRLIVVEVLIMAAVMGVSVTLGTTPPPVPQSNLAENAELLALPDPWFTGLLTQWQIDPLFLLLAGAGTWVYVSWVRRLRRRGDAWPAGRTASWLIAMAVLVWVTNGGPGVYGESVFSVHMLQHMILLSVLPIPLALSAPVSLGLRALPRRTDGTAGPRELLLAALHARWAQFLAHPVVAALHVVVAMAVFYFSPLFELALRSHVAHVVMIVHFTLIGYLFTNAMIGLDPGPLRPPHPLRLALLLPSTVFHTAFGLFLLSSGAPLAADHFSTASPHWAGMVADQQMGGAVSWALGEIPVLALAVILALRWAAQDERNQIRARERAANSAR